MAQRDAETDWLAVRLRQHAIRESWTAGEAKARELDSVVHHDRVDAAMGWLPPEIAATTRE